MKIQWTELKALDALQGDVKVINKTIIVGTKGLGGLKACSAMDYLRKICGYR